MVTVTPTSDTTGDIDIHVTDHGACSGGSHVECVFSPDLASGVCLPEHSPDYQTTYDSAALEQAILYCQCFTDDDPCQNNLPS